MTAQGLVRKSQLEAITILQVTLTIYEWLLYRVNTQIETSLYVHKVHWGGNMYSFVFAFVYSTV